MRTKVNWNTPEHDIVANALGYNTHNAYMRKYSKRIMDFDPDAEIVLHIVPADHFKPVPNKINVLFTMWEFMKLPASYMTGINRADAVIVPSSFCRDLFRPHTTNKVYVCHEGIEDELYPYHPRKLPDVKQNEKFRFLWVGAPNPRKGYPFILEAIKIFETVPFVEVYLKTTMPKLNWRETIVNAWRRRKEIFTDGEKRVAFNRMLRRIPKPSMQNRVQHLGKHKNIIMDTRKLPFEQLRDLYNSAHCFILPTMGEGWGLTLCEAMATGCPSIATAVTGCADFFNEDVGYPLQYKIVEQDLANYGVKAKGYIPSTQDLVNKMAYVMSNYAEALRRGRKASDSVHKSFTWEQSAHRLDFILRDIAKTHGILKEEVKTCNAEVNCAVS